MIATRVPGYLTGIRVTGIETDTRVPVLITSTEDYKKSFTVDYPVNNISC